MSKKDKQIDWAAVRADFRAGQLSNRVIAERHGCSEAGIRKKAKEEGWKKDLTRQVQKEVRAQLVRGTQCADGAHDSSTDRMTDDEIVEKAALSGAEVVRNHRKDIREAARVCGILMSQLVDAAQNRDDIEEMIEEETKHDENGTRRARMKAAISLPRHAGTMLNLSASLKNLIGLERQAFNLDEKPDGSTYEEELDRLLNGEDDE